MPTIDTTCPTCGAPHAKKLSQIHREGISTVQTSTRSTGKTNTILAVSINNEGSSLGVQQTELSKSAAPPDMASNMSPTSNIGGALGLSLIGALLIIPGVVVGTGYIGSVIGYDQTLLRPLGLFIGILAASVPVAHRVLRSPSTEQRSAQTALVARQQIALQEWERTFACVSCGHRFIPSDLEPIKTSGTNPLSANSPDNQVGGNLAAMTEFGITFDGSHYHFEQHRYERFSDALAYAKNQTAKLQI